MKRVGSFFVFCLALICTLAMSTSLSAAEAAPAVGISQLQSVVLLVLDQDKALQWYTEKLGFEKKVDQAFGNGQRWLTIVPKGQSAPEIVLQKATPAQQEQVGKSLEWVFGTADCRKAYETLKSHGVKFMAPPDVQPWGVQVQFEDLYGNRFTLISEK